MSDQIRMSPSTAKKAFRCAYSAVLKSRGLRPHMSQGQKRTRYMGILFESLLFDQTPGIQEGESLLLYNKHVNGMQKDTSYRIIHLANTSKQHFQLDGAILQGRMEMKLPENILLNGYYDYKGIYLPSKSDRNCMVDVKFTEDIHKVWRNTGEGVEHDNIAQYSQVAMYSMSEDVVGNGMEKEFSHAVELFMSEGYSEGVARILKQFPDQQELTRAFFHVVENTDTGDADAFFTPIEVEVSMELYLHIASMLVNLSREVQRADFTDQLYVMNVEELMPNPEEVIRPSFGKCRGGGYSGNQHPCEFLSLCRYGRKFLYGSRKVDLLQAIDPLR